jgi:SAM-dependent methyltransferase
MSDGDRPTVGRSWHDAFDEHLRLQAELWFGVEHPHLVAETEWADARRIVDIGCGNGAYLELLAAAHPDKRFVGVDLDRELIDRARRRSTAPNVRYVAGEVTAVRSRADLAISRFCLLYAPRREAIALWMRDRLAGPLVEIDNDDPPPVPDALAAVWDVLTVRRRIAADGGSRSARVETAPTWATAGFGIRGGWTVDITSAAVPEPSRLRHWLACAAELETGLPLPPPVEAALCSWDVTADPFRYRIRATTFAPATPAVASRRGRS